MLVTLSCRSVVRVSRWLSRRFVVLGCALVLCVAGFCGLRLFSFLIYKRWSVSCSRRRSPSGKVVSCLANDAAIKRKYENKEPLKEIQQPNKIMPQMPK